MMKQNSPRPTSGAKAIAIDQRAMQAKIWLAQLLALIAGALTTLGLHLLFAR